MWSFRNHLLSFRKISLADMYRIREKTRRVYYNLPLHREGILSLGLRQWEEKETEVRDHNCKMDWMSEPREGSEVKFHVCAEISGLVGWKRS